MKKLMKHLVATSIVCSAAAAFAQAPNGNGNGNQNVPNLTGWWTSGGGGTAQLFQEAKKITGVFVTPDFAHRIFVTWDGATQTFKGDMTRIRRVDNCALKLEITYTPQPDGSLQITANLDPAMVVPPCSDLVPGQTYSDINTKIGGS